MRAGLLLILGLALAPAPAARTAGDESAVVHRAVHVTGVSGQSVYLDAGRDAAIEPGDSVLIHPLGQPEVECTVRAVARTSARAEARGPVGGIEIGTEGEVLLPAERVQAAAASEGGGAAGSTPPGDAGGAPTPAEDETPESTGTSDDDEDGTDDGRVVPEHPPWEAPPESWDQDMPLLAPPRAQRPEERPSEVSGRAFARTQWSENRIGGVDSYLNVRTGADVGWSNPFGRGGRLELEGEYSLQRAGLSDQPDETRSRGRIDRFSYAWGGVRGEPGRWQVGRFLQHEFPELGLLDGVEWEQRTAGGSRYGASFGYLPEPTDELRTGTDLATSVFYRHVSDEAETFSLGTAYQKTWHEGKADRDLLVTDLDWHPGPATSVAGVAWIDYYGSDARVKSPGLELTQVQLNVDQRLGSATGIGAFLARVRWPELLRNEYPDATLQQVADFDLTRVGLRGWRQLSRHARLSGRVAGWRDREDTGGNGELRLGLRDLLYEGGEVALVLFDTEGKFSSGLGARLSATRTTRRGLFSLTYEATSYSQTAFVGSQGDLLQQAVRLGWDVRFGSDWTLSLNAEQRFGDEQDATSLGFLLQKRF